jgi:hypothetical protein
MKYYTGVGSRQTPNEILNLMTKVAEFLYKQNYNLRSGSADGADQAFEKGAKEKKEIFLPWKGFNDSTSTLYEIPERAFIIAEAVHPAWNKCNDQHRRFHARNVLQVIGKDLNDPSDFLICWTKNAMLIGGTAVAIRIAILYEVPIFNLALEEDLKRIKTKIGG